MTANLSTLNRKKGNIKAQINKLCTFQQSEKSVDISAHINVLNKIQEKFEVLKSEYYESVKDEEIDEIEESLSAIDNELQDLEVRFQKLLLNCNTKEENSSNFSVNKSVNIENSTNLAIKLPEIPLPIFTGKLEEWSSFKLQFQSLINDYKCLSDNQKLYYLRAALKGEAKSIETSDDSYESLFKALEERFENKRLLVDIHVKNIINYEKLTQENARDLRKFLDCITKNLRALKILKYEKDTLSNVLLLNIILQKLAIETRKQYELSLVSTEVPEFDDLLDFLEKRYLVLNNISRNLAIKSKHPEKVSSSKTLFVKSPSAKATFCVLCKNSHSLYKCDQFNKLTPEKRYALIRKNNLCLNCFGFHKVAFCRSKYFCSICKSKHHSLLHRDESPSLAPSVDCKEEETDSIINSKTDDESSNSSQKITSCFASEKKKIILATTVVYVLDSNGSFLKARAILDSGSMCCCMTTKFADLLGFKKCKVNIPVSGLTGCSVNVKKKIHTSIANEDKSFISNLDFLIVPNITDLLPGSSLDVSKLEIPANIKLADPLFFKPGTIDILIGAELFFDLLLEGKINTAHSVIFQKTVFGYVCSGTIEGISKPQHCGFLAQENVLEDTIKRFWEIESVLDIPNSKNKEEIECEEHFLKTYQRDENGKYIVSLPIKENSELGESFEIAKRKLKGLHKRLRLDSEMTSLYSNFMEEYEQLGHMEELKDINSHQLKYVMPHHGVYKAESRTTKLRVVFNASSPSTNGLSLNDCLLNGGIVQEDLFSILLRFRQHKIVFTADIQKMYRQIWINPDQCYLQCILWNKEFNENPKVYKLLTVTYGTKSAPYLATRALKQLAIDGKDAYPLASAAALKDFYVDDILTGADDITSAIELQQQLIDMLRTAKMELHKWCSNDKRLMEQVPLRDKDYQFDDNDSQSVKTLGLKWNPNEDIFNFTISLCSNKITKRSVLAEIASIFDPLGLLGPVIVKTKIFLQKLWILKVEWDEELPLKERKSWERFRSVLTDLQNLKIPRYISTGSEMKDLTLHGFSDASKDAYGAAVYLRCITASNQVKVTLLCSKSRVAPIKVLTIPRLELCAAELLSKLVSKVLLSLTVEVSKVYLYTDSTIVLTWIDSSPHLLKVFVSNRISRIQELTKEYIWKWVSTNSNPADLISRGTDPDQIANNSLWFHGPDFLYQDIDSCSEAFPVSDECYLEEFKNLPINRTLTVSTTETFFDSLFSITNCFTKLIRIVSFIFRFFHNLKNPSFRRCGPLSSQELQKGKIVLIHAAQVRNFKDDIDSLFKGKPLTGKLRSLNAFLDNNSILRVGGRLQNCNINLNKKHPIILPANHKLTNMIIEYFHKKYFHLGPQNLLYCVRNEYWPLRGRTTTRKIVHNCITCFKAKPLTSEQIMGNLPKERLNSNFTFNCSGVDFCGPFFIKYRGQRKGIFHKIYVCIFVCMVTKAVHFDLVCDLTSQAFIATLKRFFARRGKSQKIFSDNAKNFSSANTELKRLHNLVTKPDNELSSYLAFECIEWKFLPPRAPNFGGLWEAGVKSFKHHFKRVVGNSKLTYEEFLTVTCQIEGILNSRPLTPLSDDIDDLEILTPGHFLIGRAINTIAEPSVTIIPENRLNLWQRTTKMVQTIWQRWQNSYLSTLQQRNKWMVLKNNIKVGDMVIVKEDNLPICRWALGRVVDIFVGKDNNIRVVNIKTQNGIFKRSISKIAVLPMENK